MTKDEIIEAFENLRYFESTCEVEWGRVQAEADRAIEALKQGQLLPIDSVSQQRELLLAYEKSKCPETWWVSKRQTECEIEDFLANNCG